MSPNSFIFHTERFSFGLLQKIVHDLPGKPEPNWKYVFAKNYIGAALTFPYSNH